VNPNQKKMVNSMILTSIKKVGGDDLFASIIEEIGGENAIKVANALSDKDEATDEEIAEKTEMRLNAVRKVLYRLYENRLASYRRTRDTRTGWFIYFWKLNPEKLRNLIISRKQMVFQRLNERLEYEKGNMLFHCGNADCEQLTFDGAMDVSFKCPTCSNTLIFVKNDKSIEILENKIEELEEELKDLKF